MCIHMCVRGRGWRLTAFQLAAPGHRASPRTNVGNAIHGGDGARVGGIKVGRQERLAAWEELRACGAGGSSKPEQRRAEQAEGARQRAGCRLAQHGCKQAIVASSGGKPGQAKAGVEAERRRSLACVCSSAMGVKLVMLAYWGSCQLSPLLHWFVWTSGQR